MNAIRPIRILGLDPGLRKTGWGVVTIEGARLTHVAHGVIAPKDSLPFAARLLILFEAIAEVIALHAPHEAVVGTGSADKTQVGFMIRRLLPTAGDTTADAADALAVAIAHAHARRARSYLGAA